MRKLPADPEAKKLYKALQTLTEANGRFLGAMDALMRNRDSVERGKQIAALCNALEMANDTARYFALGIDFRTDKKVGGEASRKQ